jgi:hypothetical protein
MIAGEFRDLVLPVLEPVELAVDEDEAGTLPLQVVVEVAAIRLDGGHAVGLAGKASSRTIESAAPPVNVARDASLPDLREIG